MSDTITDLTGTSWQFNDTLSTSPSGWSLGDDSGRSEIFYINFTFVYHSLTTNADFISFTDLDSGPDVIRYYVGVNSPEVYSFFTGWLSPIYKNINIIGGTDATNQDLIDWLLANATQIIEEEPISSFNELEVIDHTDYITLTIQGNTINIAKLIYDYVFLNGNLTINNAPYTFTEGVLEI